MFSVYEMNEIIHAYAEKNCSKTTYFICKLFIWMVLTMEYLSSEFSFVNKFYEEFSTKV